MRSYKHELLQLIDRMNEYQIRLVLSFVKNLFNF